MTKIERVVKEVSDLRDFYLRLQRERGREEPPVPSTERADSKSDQRQVAGAKAPRAPDSV